MKTAKETQRISNLEFALSALANLVVIVYFAFTPKRDSPFIVIVLCTINFVLGALWGSALTFRHCSKAWQSLVERIQRER